MAQMIMAVEEIAELTQELTKLYRGKEPGPDLFNELADVQIMVEQMRTLFETDGQVDDQIEKKLERLEYRIRNKHWPNESVKEMI